VQSDRTRSRIVSDAHVILLPILQDFSQIRYYPRAVRAFEHIVTNIDKPVRVADLADVAGMEPTAFCRFLRCKIGITPKELVLRGKVAFAAALLRRTDHSITEVADRVGLSEDSLRRAVRRITGEPFAVFKAAQFRAAQHGKAGSA